MKSLGYVGKLLFALPMALFGIFHFMNANAMTGLVPPMFPYPEVWVYLTGLSLVLAAIAIIIGKKARLAASLLGVMTMLFALLIHLSGFLSGDPVASSAFLKDIAIAGSAFFIASKVKN